MKLFVKLMILCTFLGVSASSEQPARDFFETLHACAQTHGIDCPQLSLYMQDDQALDEHIFQEVSNILEACAGSMDAQEYSALELAGDEFFKHLLASDELEGDEEALYRGSKTKKICKLIAQKIVVGDLRVCGSLIACDGRDICTMVSGGGTPCDTPNTVVSRDANGSFAATTITLDGNSLINYSSVGGCDTGAGYVWAPTLQNSFIGLNAANHNQPLVTGTSNVALGFDALASLTGGINNVAIGAFAAESLTGGRRGLSIITGSDNIAIGVNSLLASQNGFQNIAIGTDTLRSAADSGQHTLTHNIAIGYQALRNTQATDGRGDFLNIGIGTQALYYNTAGTQNTALGHQALYYNVDGQRNTAVGYAAMSANNAGHGDRNTALGFEALGNNTDGNDNTALGNNTLLENDTGTSNVAVGSGALQANISGGTNVAVGQGALSSNNADNNVAVGSNAMTNNTSGVRNTAVGTQALSIASSPTDTIAIGFNALSQANGGNNIGIGFNVGVPSLTNGTNNIYIGNSVDALVDESSTIRIGNVPQMTAAGGRCFIGGIGNTTTASAANVFVDSVTGQLQRSTSSKRFKTDIKSLSKENNIVQELNPVSFKSKNGDSKEYFGFIAEEIAQLAPNLALYDSEGLPNGIEYNGILALAVLEIQKLQQRVIELEAAIRHR